jgi:hypothetical protein
MKSVSQPKKLILSRKTILKLTDQITSKMIGGASEGCVSDPRAGCNTQSDDRHCTTSVQTQSGRFPFTITTR